MIARFKYYTTHIWLVIMICAFASFWIFNGYGSDPTMDYSSLKGSGLSPKDYDDLVIQRQFKYAENMELYK